MTARSALIADRDSQALKDRSSILAREGLHVYQTSRGTEALEFVERYRPAIALLTSELADLDGIDVCSRLKAEPRLATPVILSLPASLPEARLKVAFASGADAFLVEPQRPEVLTTLIRSLIRLQQADRELAAAKTRLGEMQIEFEHFASQVCHDIEEPLRGVATFAQLIEERREGGLSSEERTYLGYVEAACNRVRRLMRGILSYSQAGRRARLIPLDLGAPVTAAVQSLRGRLEDGKASVHFAVPGPKVWGDFGDLQKVFEHLIGNAVLYRKLDSPSVIFINAVADSESAAHGECLIAVSDNGVGIPPDLQSSVFLPFKRLHGREIPGAGLGLAISKRIVEAHSGRMWLTSKPGEGATIHLTLRTVDQGEALDGPANSPRHA